MLNGCITTNNENHTISLKDMALTLDDLPSTFEIFQEEHITEPYVADENLLFGGWTILEKYEVTFLDNTTQNNTHFMQHLLTRLESANKTTEFIENIRQDKGNFLYNFTELPVEQIGEETYLGVNNTTIFQINVTIYMLCFKINDIGVVLLSPYFSKEDLIMYAKTVETRIQETMETEESP